MASSYRISLTSNAAGWNTASCGCARYLSCQRLVAFSCKRRGFCPSCGARRMAESAALLVDEVLPQEPMRQWVLSFPFQLRFLFASRPAIMGQVLGIIYRVIATHLTKKAGYTKETAQTGAVMPIQRFGSAPNLNIHFHMLFLGGVYIGSEAGSSTYRIAVGPQQGRKVFTLQTLAAACHDQKGTRDRRQAQAFGMRARL